MIFKLLTFASACIASQINGSVLFAESPVLPKRTMTGDGILELFVIKVVLDECSETELPMYSNSEHETGQYGMFVSFSPNVCFYFNETYSLNIAGEVQDAPKTCSHPLPNPDDDTSGAESSTVRAVTCKYAVAFVYHLNLVRERHQVSDAWVTRKAPTTMHRRRINTDKWRREHLPVEKSKVDPVDHAREFELPNYIYSSIKTLGESIVDIVEDGVYGQLVEQDTLSLGKLISRRRLLVWLPEPKGQGINNSGFHWLGDKNLGIYAIEYDPFYSEPLGPVVLPIIPTSPSASCDTP